MKILLLFCAFLFATTPEQALQKSALFYRSGANVSFAFTVDIEYEVTGETASYEGTLLVAGKDKFNLKTPTLELISDGVDLWEYRPKSKQVLVKSLLDLENSLHPSDILFKYLECKPLTIQKKNGSFVLELDPKGKIKALEHMKVWLTPKTFEPTQLQTTDVAGNISLYKLSDMKRNRKLSANTFQFAVPQGVEEIDMR